MRLAIRHTTRYRFDTPVAHALQRLRLTPKNTQGQRILDWTMEFENAEPQLGYEDEHRNTVTLAAAAAGAGSVSVTCHGNVEISDHAGVIGKHSGFLPLWAFREQTPLTRLGAELRKLCRAFEASGDPIERLHRLSAEIRGRIDYRPGRTHPGTSAEEALCAGGGVCQDHAHVFIGAARALDIPARYVSGYMVVDDQVELRAMHAWAEAHVEGLGWVGFDISNGISPDARYVRVATGRDYRDAAPVSGISFGSCTQSLEVEVAVARQQGQQ